MYYVSYGDIKKVEAVPSHCTEKQVVFRDYDANGNVSPVSTQMPREKRTKIHGLSVYQYLATDSFEEAMQEAKRYLYALRDKKQMDIGAIQKEVEQISSKLAGLEKLKPKTKSLQP